eukprot:1225026-Rhodomonas_salina.2
MPKAAKGIVHMHSAYGTPSRRRVPGVPGYHEASRKPPVQSALRLERHQVVLVTCHGARLRFRYPGKYPGTWVARQTPCCYASTRT